MPTYIALLRGINVSGQRIIPMADLKALFVKLGFKDARTFIQSGNVVFTGPAEGERAYITYLAEPPSKEGVKALEAARTETDDFVIAKTAVYILVRAGYGKTQFSNNFVEKKLKVRATSRNLESSRKLIALAETQ